MIPLKHVIEHIRLGGSNLVDTFGDVRGVIIMDCLRGQLIVREASSWKDVARRVNEYLKLLDIGGISKREIDSSNTYSALLKVADYLESRKMSLNSVLVITEK